MRRGYHYPTVPGVSREGNRAYSLFVSSHQHPLEVGDQALVGAGVAGQ